MKIRIEKNCSLHIFCEYGRFYFLLVILKLNILLFAFCGRKIWFINYHELLNFVMLLETYGRKKKSGMWSDERPEVIFCNCIPRPCPPLHKPCGSAFYCVAPLLGAGPTGMKPVHQAHRTALRPPYMCKSEAPRDSTKIFILLRSPADSVHCQGVQFPGVKSLVRTARSRGR